jgi:hypothetical protein
MAQTRRKRRSKHRGTAAGTIETRGRTGRKPTSADNKKPKSQQTAAERRAERLNRPPSWKSAINRAAIAAVILVALSILAFKQKPATSIAFAGFALLVYIPMGYYLDRFLYNRRMRSRARAEQGKR